MKNTFVCKWSALVMLVTGLLLVSCSERPPLTEIPPEFETYNRDPGEILILTGPSVVPIVIERIKDKSMVRRTSAMFLLGNGRYRESLPVLRDIFHDTSDPHRDNTLIAIFKIDQAEGAELAQKVPRREDKVGKIAMDIIQRKSYLFERRSYIQAWLAYRYMEPRD